MSLRRFALALSSAVVLGSILLQAQVPGQNVNMVTGKTFPGGDPYLQKQNEPSLAVSTLNPCVLVGGANDYRAVNLPGNTFDKENGDAWVGWYTSIDCGQTWYSTLIPGYPQDTTTIGKASPVYGLTTGADPTFRAGPGGFFAGSFIAFNRGSNVGKLALARFVHKNNREAVTKADTAVTYIDTTQWDVGSAGQFIDKPTEIITAGTGTCTLGGNVIPASVVHMAWTVFVGNDQNIRTKVYYARSSNCGGTLDFPPTKLSEGYAVNQSASIAVAPNGTVFVVWRQFATDKGDLNQILMAKSIDGGKTFTKASPIPIAPFFAPIDQGTTSKSFRTNAFPATAVDQYNRLYVAVAARGFANDVNQSRIVVMNTLDGLTWSSPMAIDNDPSVPGHQIMPALNAAGGNLNAVWLDFHDDVATRSGFGPFDAFIREIYPIRHTMDVRGAQAALKPDGSLSWTKYGILQDASPDATVPRISKYLIGDYNDAQGDTHKKQLQFNRVNLKLYAGGTRPFIGDYIDVAGLAFLAKPAALNTTTWVPNNGSDPLSAITAAQTFYAAWTDNRDANVGSAQPEPVSDTEEGNGVAYNPPTVSGSCPNPALTKTRNANVYMSRISPGLFVAAPANSKPSVNASGRLQRAFDVLVVNRTPQIRKFTITIANQPPDFGTTGVASLRPIPAPIPPVLPPPVITADVILPGNSSATRAVHVVSNVKYPRIKVDVVEQLPLPPGSTAPLTGSTILNPDVDNPDIDNPDVDNPDVDNQGIQNQEIHNPDVDNPDIDNPDVDNPDVDNPDVDNPDVDNPDVDNPDIDNPDIDNPDIDNPDVDNPDIDNPDIDNGALTDYTVDLKNDGNTTTGYQVKFAVVGDTSPYKFQLIARREYKTPTAAGCKLTETAQNQVLFNVNLDTLDLTPGPPPDQLDPKATNTTLLVKPGEHIKLTLRAWDKDVLTGPTAPPNDGIQPFCPMLSPNCPVVTSEVITTVTSLSTNSGQNTPPTDTIASTPTPVPFTLIVTNTNDSGPGSLRNAITTANSHTGFRDEISFQIPGAGVHTINLASPLPQITEAVKINGTSQPGYAGSPVIELNGAGAGAGANGLTLAAGSGSSFSVCPPPPGLCDPGFIPGTEVRGLAINRFLGNGILILSSGNVIAGNYIGTNPAGTADFGNSANGIQIIDAANNTIGGSGGAPDRNVISGNNAEGIRLDGESAHDNMIRGNYIGTNALGTAAVANSASGVYLRKAPNNSVIQNVISGNNGFAGVAICGDADASATPCGGFPSPGTNTSNASGNIIQGNRIGTRADGTGALGNSQLAGVAGVSIDAAPNTLVGGPLTPADGNIISANRGAGVLIFNPGADNNLIRGNSIGADVNGAPLGNSGNGVQISAGAGNIVSGKEEDRTAPNVIKFNGGAGIYVGAGQHEFRINQIDANGGLGITGTEAIQNGPDLTRASVNAGVVTVAGTLSGANGTYTIDLYKSSACDASGFGEGAQWFGGFTVNVVNGLGSFNVGFGGNVVAAGELVTALATTGDQITNPGTTGTTSQFSNCQMAVPPGFAFSTPSAGGNGHVYEYVQTPGTWTAARAAAAARSFRNVNGHLVTIANAFENGLVASFRGANNDLRGWIGFTDEATEGTFQWVTGEAVTYTNWNTGEPSNGFPPVTTDEDYVEIFAAGLWNDIDNAGTGPNGPVNQGYLVEYDTNPFQGVLTDFAADAGGGSNPDLIRAEIINTGINLLVHVHLTPATFSVANTEIQLLLDTDRNPATGHPGVTAGCTPDEGVIGSEYLVNIQNSSAVINQYAGTCNQFTQTSTISATATSDGYDMVIPLASLGGDDGFVNFKFVTATQIGPNAYTGVQDIMSNPGLVPGTTVIGGGS